MNEIGFWWGDVVEETRNLPLPQGMKDTLLFAEGSMVSETAIGAVDLTQIIDIDRNANFRQADELLIRELEKTRREIVKFRKENKLTWHEFNDMTSMQLVPSIINSKFGHLGGVSEVKKLLELLQ